MKTMLLLIFSLSIWISTANAQEINPKRMKNWELKGFGKNATRIGDIYSAIDYYNEFTRRKPANLRYRYMLAQLYFKARDYANSKAEFQHIYNAKPSKYSDALFYFALSLKNTGKYTQALEQFLIIEKGKRKNQFKNITKNQLENEIIGCQLALKYKDTLVTTKIIHLDTTINKGTHRIFALDCERFCYGFWFIGSKFGEVFCD